MKLFLSTALSASLLSTSVMAAEAPSAPGLQSATMGAMQCLLHQKPLNCDRMFVGAARATAQPLVFISAERAFQRGAVMSTTYRGQASVSNLFDYRALRGKVIRETAIFDVKFAHQECTFYISRPDADGKIRTVVAVNSAPHDLFGDRGPCI